MNAIDLLKADHERVKTLLTQLSESTERGVKRTELLAKLEMEITLHTQLEEEILYPAFRKAGARSRTSCTTKPRRSTVPSTRWYCRT